VENRENSRGLAEFSNSSATDVSLKPAEYHPNHHHAGGVARSISRELTLDNENQEQEKQKSSVRRRDKEKGGGGRWTGVAGNKRLANRRCQFNLASNPEEMLIRTSLPRSTAALPSRMRARARAATLYFRAKIPPLTGTEHVEIVCKASYTRRPFLFSRLPPPPSVPSSLRCYPFRPSTLVIYRGYAAAETTGSVARGMRRRRRRRRKARRSRNGATAPQYYRPVSIIRSPPSRAAVHEVMR